MADLGGFKPKDTYQQLLTLESNSISGSLKKVQDGAGADTSLELSTNVAKVDGNLEVTGTSTLTGAVNVQGTSDFDSNVNVDGTLTVGGISTLGGAVNITNNADVDGNLNVDGTSTLVGTLNVQGTSDFDSNVNMDGNLQLDGTLHVDGASTFDAAMDINAAVDIGSTVQFSSIPTTDASLYDALVIDSSGNLKKNPSLFSGDVFIARLDPSVTVDGDDDTEGTVVSSGGTNLHFKDVANNTNTGSHEFGDTSTFTFAGTNNDAIILAKAGTYRFDINLDFSTSGSSGNAPAVKIEIEEKVSGGNFLPIHETNRSKTADVLSTASYSIYRYTGVATTRYAVKCTSSGGGSISVQEGSTLTITRIA